MSEQFVADLCQRVMLMAQANRNLASAEITCSCSSGGIHKVSAEYRERNLLGPERVGGADKGEVVMAKITEILGKIRQSRHNGTVAFRIDFAGGRAVSLSQTMGMVAVREETV